MRQHYRNLFSSCLLAALILPSQQVAAAPLQEPAGGLRTDWNTNGRTGADSAPVGILSQGASPRGASDGLQEGVTTGNLNGPGREPVLGRPAPKAIAGTGAPVSAPVSAQLAPAPAASPRSGAGLLVSAAQAAPIADKPAASIFSTPPSGAGGNLAPSSGFSAPRPVMPQALTDALTALSQKKPDDAIRLARTFISQTEAKGPGPDNTPATMALAYEIVGTGFAVQGKQAEAATELQKALTINPNQGSALFKLGAIYRDQGKLVEAKANLEKAAAIGGGDPVKLYLGDVHERLGDLPAAIQLYEPLLTGARADDFKFKVHLASLYDRVNRFADAIKLLAPIVTPDMKDADALMALGFAYGGSGSPKQAIPLLVAAKALTPDNWRLDLALGTAQREVGELDNAEASLKRVVAAEPKQVQARFQLALVQMGKSQFQEAVDLLTEAIKLAPGAVELQQVRGDALFRAGKKEQAVAQFKELATRDGAVLSDHVNLARVYQAAGKLDDAAETYRDSLRKFPPNPSVYALLGGVQAEQKRFPEARETIATGRKVTPDDPRLLRALVQIELASGDLKAALPVAERLVEVQPKSQEDRYGLAVLYTQMGDRKKAISAYRAILIDSPDNPIVLNNLASVLTDEGDAKGALPMAKRAQELQPKSAATNDTLGWALLKMGQTKEALPLFETATQLEPKNPELLYHLAMAQKATNNPKAARINLEKALSISPDFNGNAEAKAALAALPK